MTHDDHEVTEASAPTSPPSSPEEPAPAPPQAETPPGIIKTLKAERERMQASLGLLDPAVQLMDARVVEEEARLEAEVLGEGRER